MSTKAAPMTPPDAYAWPTDPRITDLEHQANTLAACLIYALTDKPNREPNSQGET